MLGHRSDVTLDEYCSRHFGRWVRRRALAAKDDPLPFEALRTATDRNPLAVKYCTRRVSLRLLTSAGSVKRLEIK